ncbi:hypothetical protein ACLB1E_20325 [Escherichia coli]
MMEKGYTRKQVRLLCEWWYLRYVKSSQTTLAQIVPPAYNDSEPWAREMATQA